MNAGWIIPFIIIGGALQTCGAAMNGQLNKHMVNPWLASAISFALITFFFVGAFFIVPNPLPTTKDFSTMPWGAVIGRLVGAVQVYAGFTLVNKVGAGPFMWLKVGTSAHGTKTEDGEDGRCKTSRTIRMWPYPVHGSGRVIPSTSPLRQCYGRESHRPTRAL